MIKVVNIKTAAKKMHTHTHTHTYIYIYAINSIDLILSSILHYPHTHKWIYI